MVIEVICTHCRATLTTNESKAGLRAKCPKCRGKIQIPAITPLTADDVVDAEVVSVEDAVIGEKHTAIDRKACPVCGEQIASQAVKCRYCGEIFDKSMVGVLGLSGARDPGWKQVRAGLSTIYICSGVIFAAICGMGVLGGILGGAGALGGDEQPPFLPIALGVSTVAILIAGIGLIVGQGLCMNVPKSSGAHGYAVGAFVAMIASVMLSFASVSAQGDSLRLARSLATLAGMLLFLLFIRKAADALGAIDVARSAGRLASFGLVLAVTLLVSLFLMMAAVRGSQGERIEDSSSLAVLGIVSLVALIGVFVAVIWFLRVLRGLRTAIDRGTGS